jgi:transposase
LKVECLGELEKLSKLGLIDLYYGDESRVCLEPCVPYGWQFPGEDVFMPTSKGVGLNCFALLSRSNELMFETMLKRVTSAFILEQLERLWFSIKKITVIVLDNARVHTSEQIKERRVFWQQRGLLIFYLPPYSPHLNIAETLWRKLKYEWLQASDYATADGLFYRVRQALAAVGSSLKIQFSEFSLGSS